MAQNTFGQKIDADLIVNYTDVLHNNQSPNIIHCDLFHNNYYVAIVKFPSEKVKNYEIKLGASIKIVFLREEHYFTFIGEIKNFNHSIEGFTLVHIESKTLITQEERRKFIRLYFFENVKEVEYRIFSKDLTTSFSSLTNLSPKFSSLSILNFNKAQILDLSGSGARIRASEKLLVGTKIIIKLPILNQTLETICEVIRLKEYAPNLKYPYEIAVKLDHLSDVERDKVIKYIFSEETKRKRARKFKV